jgi:glyoxylase-like metal-dependent hydrolase (beta-lactamase superfamily II)
VLHRFGYVHGRKGLIDAKLGLRGGSRHRRADPVRGSQSAIKVHGLRGNIAVLTGADGKLLVDAGITASRLRIVEALASLGRDPIKHLINTHWHFDHTDGNEWLHSGGAEILAHENVRKHLGMAQRVEDWKFDFPPASLGAIPANVFSTEKTLKLNGSTLSLKYYGPAHTDSDISVAFMDADILHIGDTYWNGIYPFIDYSTGGSIDGMIQATKANLAVATDKTIIVPGHGQPVSNKPELKAYRDMLVGIRQTIGALKKQGRSLDETVAAKPTATHDAKWNQVVIDPYFFTTLVYEGA